MPDECYINQLLLSSYHESCKGPTELKALWVGTMLINYLIREIFYVGT